MFIAFIATVAAGVGIYVLLRGPAAEPMEKRVRSEQQAAVRIASHVDSGVARIGE